MEKQKNKKGTSKKIGTKSYKFNRQIKKDNRSFKIIDQKSYEELKYQQMTPNQEKTLKRQTPQLVKSKQKHFDYDFNTNNSQKLFREEEEDISSFYRRKKKKINVWSYLFKNFNKSISELQRMCELENKKEFIEGVVSNLKESTENFEKMLHRLKVEELNEKKPVAWELQILTNNYFDFSEYQNALQDTIESQDIDFQLLNSLVQKGKMTFYEAIVLLIREKSIYISDNTAKSLKRFSTFSSAQRGQNSDIQSFNQSKLSNDYSSIQGSELGINQSQISIKEPEPFDDQKTVTSEV